MTAQVYLTEAAKGDLRALDLATARRIVEKLTWFVEQRNPLHFALRLAGSLLGMYRFRIGNYRVIFDVNKRGQIVILVILRIKHRREVYD